MTPRPCIPLARQRRDALALAHLPLADALATVWARRFRPLLDRDDLIQVARLALLQAALRCDPDRPAAPYLRRCIDGALRHHLRDQARLVRVSRLAHESGRWPLHHFSLDVPHPEGGCWIDHLSAPTNDLPNQATPAGLIQSQSAAALVPLAPEALLEQLPADQAAALRLTVLQGLSLRRAARALEVSTSTAFRRQRQALQSLRRQLDAV